MKRVLIGCLAVTCLMLLTASVTAQEGGRIQMGNLAVRPGLTLQEVYDDNIYLGSGTNTTTEREESDWVTHVMLGLILDYSLNERGGMKLGYLGDLAYYQDNDFNDWKTHKGILGLDYKAPAGLILTIDNVYTRAQDPSGSESEYKLGVPQTERWVNDLKSKIGYDFNRLKLFGYFNFYKQKYDAEADYTQNYDTRELGVGAETRLLSLTRGFLRYHHGDTDYTDHPAGTGVTDSNDAGFISDRVNIGLTWDATAKLSGELNFGYTWKSYDNVADVSGNRYEDRNTWIASTNVTYEANPTTTLALTIVKAMRELGANETGYFDDTGIGINLKQIILARLNLLVGATYSKHDYKAAANYPGRDDDNYKANLGLQYLAKDWLMAGASYTYRKKDSNYKEYDFTNKQFMVTLGVAY